jgi:hypothetical protein
MTSAEIIVLSIITLMVLVIVYSVYTAIRFFINDDSAFTYEMHTDEDGNTYERVVDPTDKNADK